MRKKWLTLLLAGGVLLAGHGMRVYALTEEGSLTEQEISSPNEAQNMDSIVKKVLESTGEQYDAADAQRVTVYFGSVFAQGDEDVIVSVDFGKNNTVIAAYTPNGEVYEYVDNVGRFGGVSNILFVPVDSLGKDVVIIQESTDQRIGTFEENELLRGFVYEEGEGFRSVLQTPESLTAIWNDIWNTPGIQDEANWRRVQEDANWEWVAGPALEISRLQSYQVAEDMSPQDGVPLDSDYKTEEERVITNRFFWSDEWQTFILGEAIETATGETVAVLERFRDSPYGLAGFEENKSRILRKDGSEDVVGDEALREKET